MSVEKRFPFALPRVAVSTLVVLAAFLLHLPDRSHAEEQVPLYREHQDLLYYLDPSGTKRPVEAVTDWEIRKKQVLAQMQTVMGPLPSPETPVPLDVEILDEVKVGSLTRRKITYHTDSPDRVVSAYLFLPMTARQKVPAVLCLHHKRASVRSSRPGWERSRCTITRCISPSVAT